MNEIEQLKLYDSQYFETGTSPISDTEYDILKSKARLKFPNDLYFMSVGFKTTYKTIKLPFLMGGLDKVDRTTLKDWIKNQKRQLTISEKLDGNSIGCIWENGKLTFAAQRGDHEEGSDILEKARFFVPNLNEEGIIKLRGEVLLEGDLYKHFGFKNRRNGVAGLLRRDDVKPEDLKLLSVIFYEVVECPLKMEYEFARFMYIQSLGLRIPQVFSANTDDKNLEYHLCELLKEVKESAPYDIDGLVLAFDDSERENVKFPKNKKKFKVNEEAVKCKVIDVEWNVTRTGLIKPVIVIEPKEIMGVTVQRCSGFNYEFMTLNGIDKGAMIGVVRSGDVIPYVAEVFKKVNKVDYPTICPSCEKPLVILSKELICKNKECNTKNIYEVGHFFITLEADGISNKTFENLGITEVQQAYILKVEDIENLPGFGKRSAEHFVSEVKKTLKTKPHKLLAAFGIPSIGRTISKQLCNKYSFDELFKLTEKDDLGLGPITRKMFLNNIGKYENLYYFLLERGLEFEEEDMSKKNLKGMVFTLTGEGPMKRSDVQKLIEAAGGEVKGIGKKTNYLVTNDITSDSGKMKTAKNYNIEIITYEKLLNEFLKKD